MAVSQGDEVRDFYERMPYPAPVAHLDEHASRSEPGRRRAEFHLAWPDRPLSDEQTDPDRWLRHVAGGRDTRVGNPAHGSWPSTSAKPACATPASSNSGTTSTTSSSISCRSRTRPELSLTFDLVRLYRRPPSPARSRPRPARSARRAQAPGRDAPDGLRPLWPGRHLHDAGVLPARRRRRVGGTSCAICGPTLDGLAGGSSARRHVAPGQGFPHPDAMADALLHPLDRAFTGAGGVRLARALRHVVRPLDRAGALSAAMRRGGAQPACGPAPLAAAAGCSTPPSSCSAAPWSRTA